MSQYTMPKNQMQFPQLKNLIDTNAHFWKEVFLEDVGVVEGMQRGRKGLMFDGGKFSPAMDSANPLLSSMGCSTN